MANSTVDNLIALTETGVGMCLEAGASGGAYVAEAVKACMKERASRPKPTRRKPEPRKKKR